MGLIKSLFGWGKPQELGRAVGQVAEVFVANKTDKQKFEHLEHKAASEQFGLEFMHQSATWFDSLINGLNRLPRPILALGTVGLFVFAMIDPVAFASRMVGLDAVPEPLWWLLGAVVSFYFGARELHYRRRDKQFKNAPVFAPAQPVTRAPAVPIASAKPPRDKDDPKYNAALEDWRNSVASKG